ncbi:GNAT family N-acetyltransferase [Lacimicrobium sp. SS2-24]|uniref:GNAT family N-acetyltransferase n=1 Tax=Lacimicrobium sp. SS2-24 TaxID=2005569 RepID=UPI000B4AABF8|nr:GNAT family N-acetyltransferase [Lacimicrobium sp. SS2-24]
MELTYRKANSSDLEDIIQLLAKDSLGSGREDDSQPINNAYVEAFKTVEHDANNDLLIFEVARNMIGILQITFIPGLTYIGSWRCTVAGVRIKDEYRGKGFGKLMFEHVLNIAREKGCKLVQH